MCTMMQVQGSNMMDSMGGNPAAAFWGARHPSWPATSHASHQGSNATPNQDPKVAEKLMTELQVRFPLLLAALMYWSFLVLNIMSRRLSYLIICRYQSITVQYKSVPTSTFQLKNNHRAYQLREKSKKQPENTVFKKSDIYGGFLDLSLNW